jgi:hypothetical protein
MIPSARCEFNLRFKRSGPRRRRARRERREAASDRAADRFDERIATTTTTTMNRAGIWARLAALLFFWRARGDGH